MGGNHSMDSFSFKLEYWGTLPHVPVGESSTLHSSISLGITTACGATTVRTWSSNSCSLGPIMKMRLWVGEGRILGKLLLPLHSKKPLVAREQGWPQLASFCWGLIDQLLSSPFPFSQEQGGIAENCLSSKKAAAAIFHLWLGWALQGTGL